MAEWWANDALADPKAAPPAAPTTEGNWWQADPVAPPQAEAPDRTWTGHPAPTNVREGMQQIGRDVMEAGRRVGGALESAGKTSHDLLTGELPPTPENVLPAVAATITPAARGTAAAIASVAGRRGVAPAAEVASNLPRFTQSGGGQATAESLAGVPVIGKPIREAAQKGIDDFGERVITAVTKPTGSIPSQARAGRYLQQAIKDEEKFMTPRGGPMLELGDEAKRLPVYLNRIAEGNPNNAAAHLLVLAGTGRNANPAAIGQIRPNLVPAQWQEIQGASLARLGRVKESPNATPTFDPGVLLQRYENELSPAGKNILFGTPQKSPLRQHLDSLVADSKKMESLRAIPEGPTVGGVVKAAGLAGWAMVEPMSALAAVMGARRTASLLAKPHTAAALADWSKAYVRFFQSGGSPAGLAALKIATNNLRNTSGEDIDPEKLVGAMRQGGAPQPQPMGLDSAVDTGPYAAAVEGEHGIPFTMKMSPKGLKSLGSMRRMDPALIEDKRREPPPPPEIMSESSKQTDRRYKQMTLDWRDYKGALPRGPLSEAAGLADLETMQWPPQGGDLPVRSVRTTIERPQPLPPVKPRVNSARESKATEEAERQARNRRTPP